MKGLSGGFEIESTITWLINTKNLIKWANHPQTYEMVSEITFEEFNLPHYKN